MTSQREIWDRIYSCEADKWKKETRTLLNSLKNKTVLELGAGNGKTLSAIMQKGPKKVVAIDISKEAVKRCKKKFENERVEVKEGDAGNLEFEDESFDAVVCYYILNNLEERERTQAVKEIERVLKKTGCVLFEDFSEGDFRQNSEGRIVAPNTLLKKNGLLCHFFSTQEIKTLFEKFSKIKIEEEAYKVIKGKPELMRRIILAEIVK